MTVPEAMANFQTALKDLMDSMADGIKSREILGEMLATLSLPANRQLVLAGDKKAISNLFTFFDSYAAQYAALGKKT